MMAPEFGTYEDGSPFILTVPWIDEGTGGSYDLPWQPYSGVRVTTCSCGWNGRHSLIVHLWRKYATRDRW